MLGPMPLMLARLRASTRGRAKWLPRCPLVRSHRLLHGRIRPRSEERRVGKEFPRPGPVWAMPRAVVDGMLGPMPPMLARLRASTRGRAKWLPRCPLVRSHRLLHGRIRPDRATASLVGDFPRPGPVWAMPRAVVDGMLGPMPPILARLRASTRGRAKWLPRGPLVRSHRLLHGRIRPDRATAMLVGDFTRQGPVWAMPRGVVDGVLGPMPPMLARLRATTRCRAKWLPRGPLVRLHRILHGWIRPDRANALFVGVVPRPGRVWTMT